MSEVDAVDEFDETRPHRPPPTPAQRRARRQTVTLLLVCGLLLVAFLFAAAYYGGWFASPKTTASTPCTPASTAPKVAPSQVHVNVYNASKRTGLAKKVAAQLKLQGYVTGTIANDPLNRAVKTPVEVRYGAKGKAGAELVAGEVTGAKLVLDKRKDASVDLVLGPSYSKIGTPASTPTGGHTCAPTSTATSSAPTGTKPSPSTTKKP